ncbi:MAG: hypothetical protein RI898_1287 [Actinomycetota bacterium]
MLNVFTGERGPDSARRNEGGTFPIVAFSQNGALSYATEAIMLSAGTNIEWLRDDMGLISSSSESHDIASQCETTEGVAYVPALLGLGTPFWDYGARGSIFGITRGTTRAHIVRAVLEGVAHRGVDLVDAAEKDSGLSIRLCSRLPMPLADPYACRPSRKQQPSVRASLQVPQQDNGHISTRQPVPYLAQHWCHH